MCDCLLIVGLYCVSNLKKTIEKRHKIAVFLTLCSFFWLFFIQCSRLNYWLSNSFICISTTVHHICILSCLLPLPRRLCLHRHLFVCLLAGSCKNYSADFHKIRWRVVTWAKEETIRFWW